MPGAKRADESSQSFIFPNAKFTTHGRAAHVGSKLFDINSVGIDDNFFDIGGDSLHSVRLHNLLVQSLNLKVDLVELFKFPTVRSLAEYIEQGPGRVLPGVPLQPALNAGKQRLRKQLAQRQVQ